MKPYYQDKYCTIYHGDCREVLPTLEPVDLVLTDPPYELVAKGGSFGREGRRKYLTKIEGFTDGGFDISILDPFENWMVFCAKEQLPALIEKAKLGRWMLITWNKPNPTPLINNNYLPDTEYLVHRYSSGRLFGSYADKSRFIVHPSSARLSHPNEKPIPVMTKMVRLGSLNGETILDPFMGSGTTLRAAKDLGRKAIGIELEEKYCEVAAKRLAQEVFDFSETASDYKP